MGSVSAEDLEKYETEMELTLYKEYRDIVSQFSFVVETERRFYLANSVDVAARNADGEIYFEVRMSDAWVWDMYRPARFVKNVRVLTFKDVNVEELDKPDLELPDEDVTMDMIKRTLIIAGTPGRVLDQLVALREETGHFGTLLMGGHDWDQPKLWQRSMELLANDVMPKFSRHADATPAR